MIIDPSDKPKGETVSITLQPDGSGKYQLDLTGYTSGVYSAVVSKGNSQNTEIFTVGLQTGSGEIEINTTKLNYLPGDSVLILGDTASNVLLTIIMTDPDGNIIKEKETFSDKNGKISESSFRIPTDTKHGMWTIKAQSGSNFDTVEIEVLSIIEEGMIVTVQEIEDQNTAHLGKTIQIKVIGAKQTVEIEIIAADGEIIETLSFVASGQGEIIQPWIVPKETEPGIYTVKVEDASNSAQTTFELK